MAVTRHQQRRPAGAGDLRRASGEGARLGERLCLERRDLRAGRHARPQRARREAVLTRDLRAALERLNPDLPPPAIDDAMRALTVHDFSRSMVQHNQDFYRLIRNGVPVTYRDAAGRQRSPAPA